MKPFILRYSENLSLFPELLDLEYSEALGLSVIRDTNEPCVNVLCSSMDTFTRVNKESTDHKLTIDPLKSKRQKDSLELDSSFMFAHFLRGDTVTLVATEVTDTTPKLSLIAKRLSLETVTKARESTDVK